MTTTSYHLTSIRRSPRAALAAVVVLALGCSGDEPEEDGELVAPSCTTRGPRMMRRLTNLQLRNTMRAVFQDPNVPTGDVLSDPVVLGFKVDATQAVVRDLDAQLIMNYAESVADWAIAQKLGQLTSCQSRDRACVEQLVTTLGKKLYREPVPEESVETYVEMFEAEPSFAEGARVVISSMLQSPYVLYRREMGERGKDDLYHLTPYELASSLSYMLTNGPPDDALMAAADEGRLATTADLDREASRLLDRPESELAFGAFARAWLEIEDLASRAKIDPTNQLTSDVRTSMLEESSRLFFHVLRTNAPISELFAARYTFLDQRLASYYQLGGVGGGFQRVELPANTRARGLLGGGSVLTRHALAAASSPVQRGKLVRERLLCEVLTPPPAGVDTNIQPPMGAMTTRERYEQHSELESCQGCHARIDPIGFAFEHFDAFGRKRDQENGQPIDATGSLTGLDGRDVSLDGLDSLSTELAGSTQVSQCVARFLSYHAYGLDHCSEADIRAEVARGDGSLRSLVMAIIHAPQFATRTED